MSSGRSEVAPSRVRVSESGESPRVKGWLRGRLEEIARGMLPAGEGSRVT